MIKPKITLCLIATNKYKQFVRPVLESAAEFLFKDHELEICLFTDKPEYFEDYQDEILENVTNYRYLYNICGRFNIKMITIPPHGFPAATLYRYAMFTEHKKEITGDYVMFSDVDMLFKGEITDDILHNGITAVLHPGFYSLKGGAWCNNIASKAFTPEVNRTAYYCGGVQFGERTAYLEAARILSENIKEDDNNGVLAEWHDEAHWNKLLSEMNNNKVLTPEFCMVDNPDLQKEWGLLGIEPKIVALSKNHDELREITRE